MTDQDLISKQDELTDAGIPVLPLRDVVVYPHMVIPLFVGRERSIVALDRAMNAGKRILLVAQKTADLDDPQPEDLYDVGTLATILQLLKLPDGTVKVLVEGGERASIDNIVVGDHFAADISILAEEDRHDEREIDVRVSVIPMLYGEGVVLRLLADRLLRAAERGVRVRLLLDDMDLGGRGLGAAILDSHPNMEVRLFNPFARRDRRGLDFLTDTRRVNHRMHNKTLTADSIATIFGGRNIGDEYFAATTELGFGDMDALAIGPIAKEVSSQFDLYWNSELVYPLTAFDWDTPVDPAAVAEFRKQSDAHVKEAVLSEYADVIRQFETIQVDIEESKLAIVPFGMSDSRGQPVKEELAVRQPGQTVGERIAALLLLLALLGHGQHNERQGDTHQHRHKRNRRKPGNGEGLTQSLDRDDENEGDPGQVAQPHKHKKADGGPAELPVANPAQLQRGGKIIRCKEDAPDNQARI